jgi:hypothetical protein
MGGCVLDKLAMQLMVEKETKLQELAMSQQPHLPSVLCPEPAVHDSKHI